MTIASLAALAAAMGTQTTPFLLAAFDASHGEASVSTRGLFGSALFVELFLFLHLFEALLLLNLPPNLPI